MRIPRSSLAALLLIASGGAAPAATLCDSQVGFSADRTLVLDGRTYTGKIWTMPGRERHEQTIHAVGASFILRDDTPLGEIVVPSLKTVVQFTMPAELHVLDLPQ